MHLPQRASSKAQRSLPTQHCCCPQHTMADQDTSMDAQQAAPAALLPQEVLAAILQHVPLQHRLQQCAAVCMAWAGAAAAATTSLVCKAPPAAKFPALNAWLAQHGKQLSVLALTAFSPVQPSLNSLPLQLRCAELSQLTKLDLSDVRVELQLPDSTQPTSTGPSHSSQVAPRILPQLRELRLSDCPVGSAALLQLPPLPGVTRLELAGTCWAEDRKHVVDSDTAISLMRCCTQLAELKLAMEPSAVCKLVSVVPSSVTRMHLWAYCHVGKTSCLPRRPNSTPQRAQLQQLTLEYLAFYPEVLASMPQLVQLELDCCLLLPSQPDGAVAGGATAFLAAVRGLHKLQHLVVSYDDTRPVLSKAWPQDYAALTASAQLTKLQLCGYQGRMLPLGAVPHMFPAGRQLQQLRDLSLTCGQEGGPCMRSTDLLCIFAACPALSTLYIMGAVQPGGSLAALLQLPATCHDLGVGGAAFDDSSVATVRQLTQLTRLVWEESPGLTDAGLDQLTALQGLKELYLNDDNGISAEVSGSNEGFMEDPIELKARPNKPVWQQLQDLLARNPRNSAWRQRVTDQQHQAGRLQQQILHLQRKVSELASFMQHAVVVMAYCASDSSTVRLVCDMMDMARTAISDATPTAAAAHPAGDAAGGAPGSPAADGAIAAAAAAQPHPQQQQQAKLRYLSLQLQMQAFCDAQPQSLQRDEAMQGLAAMSAIALRAIMPQQDPSHTA